MPIDVTEILQFAGIGFLLGIIGMVFKKLDIAKDVSEINYTCWLRLYAYFYRTTNRNINDQFTKYLHVVEGVVCH